MNEPLFPREDRPQSSANAVARSAPTGRRVLVGSAVALVVTFVACASTDTTPPNTGSTGAGGNGTGTGGNGSATGGTPIEGNGGTPTTSGAGGGGAAQRSAERVEPGRRLRQQVPACAMGAAMNTSGLG